MTKPKVYNEQSISELTDLTHIRHRPTAYIDSVGIAGTNKINLEIFDNASDELEYAGNGEINVFMFINKERTNYEMVIQDTGRGVPVGKMISIFSSSKVSGKFNTDNYQFSSGLYGYGATVTFALSSWFRVIAMQDVIGDVDMLYNKIPKEPTIIPNDFGYTGTIVMFSPDESIFTDIPGFIQQRQMFVDHLIHLSLFGKYRIRYMEFNNSLPKKLRKAPTVEVIEYFNGLKLSAQPTFDNSIFDKSEYVKNYFGMVKNWHGSFPITYVNKNNSLRVHGDIFINTTASQNQKTKLTFVNNVMFDDNASLHISILYKYLKFLMSSYITDKDIKNFFVDHYKLPIWLVLDVKYAGAQFAGFAKSGFKDMSFKAPYQIALNTILNTEFVSDIYHLIQEHIVFQYNKFSNNDFKPTTSKNILSRLNRPDKFQNCRTTNPQLAELFLVEGDSAKIKNGRSAEFQALYTLGGKPFNGLTEQSRLSESIANIKRNDTCQDIIRILNITPGSNDLSSLNFHKTFIMADADMHGYHITNIVIGDLYAVCPALIEAGHLYIVIPPLYSIVIKGNEPIYVRDADELNVMLAYYVYSKCIDISIKSDTYNRQLSLDEFVVFSELVIKIGEVLDRISDEFMIPALVLEQLALVSNLINVPIPDATLIANTLGCDVKYMPVGHLLMISIGSEDIIIPLTQITEVIYSKILPMYREFYYGKTQIFATTKNSNYLKNSPVSVVQLYAMFKQMNKILYIERFKGLGSMPEIHSARNCLIPETRKAYQITSIGDVKTVFDMLGNDPTERKRLVDLNIK